MPILPEPLLTCTLRGSVLILLAIALAPVIRRTVGRNGVQWMWLAVLIALLCPVSAPSPFSLRNVWAASAVVEPPKPITAPVQPVEVRISQPPPAAAPAAAESKPVPPVVPSRPIAQPQAAAQISSTSEVVLICWAAVAGLLFLQLVWRWWQTMRLVRSAQIVNDPRWEQLLWRARIRRNVRLAVTSQLRAPALAGVFRPRVLIPEAWLTDLPDSELESVLLHELGHLCRHDLIWEWLFAVARCLHWMNPIVWWAERLARHEREIACDSWALQRAESPTRYGYALLAALQRAHSTVRSGFGIVAMAESSRQIARRLRLIARHRTESSWLAWFAGVPAILALLAFATDPLPAEGSAPSSSSASKSGLPVSTKSKSSLSGRRADSVEIKTQLVRVPAATAKAMGLPIAGAGSTGISQRYSTPDFTQLIQTLRSSPGVEFLNTPRLLAREGSSASFDVIRELPYIESYRKPGDKSALWIPDDIVETWVGLHMESTAFYETPESLQIRLGTELRRLTGYSGGDGQLTKTITPEGGNWFSRLTAWQIPPGASGQPEFVIQKSDVALKDVRESEGAMVFGFADSGAEDHSVINYIALDVALK